MRLTKPIITNQPFLERWVLTGLERENEQFFISPNATVEVRLKSPKGEAFTEWLALTRNANREDNWNLSTVAVSINAANTALVDSSSVLLDLRIQGAYVDKEGADTADTYDKTWSTLLLVDQGLE